MLKSSLVFFNIVKIHKILVIFQTKHRKEKSFVLCAFKFVKRKSFYLYNFQTDFIYSSEVCIILWSYYSIVYLISFNLRIKLIFSSSLCQTVAKIRQTTIKMIYFYCFATCKPPFSRLK